MLRSTAVISALLIAAVSLCGQTWKDPVEPKAGAWKTWVISSGKDYRVPPPPDAAATRDELGFVRLAIAEKDAGIAQQVKFWNAGSPDYRWIDLISKRALAGANLTAYGHRVYTYVILAMYDAIIATWDSKYAYNRPQRARPHDQSIVAGS